MCHQTGEADIVIATAEDIGIVLQEGGHLLTLAGGSTISTCSLV